jgi:hypothetical protein
VFKQKDRVRTAALYVQDQWTRGRMTLQGAVRFDNAKSYSPEQTIGPALINGQTFLATPLHFERTDGVDFKDLSPRGGLALDVFGNGKTALKVNFGKYMDPASNLNGNYSISNPIARIATNTSRTWTDGGIAGVPGTAGDFIPQCDLTNNAANGECAASNAQTFGTAALTTAAIDEGLLRGWGVRPRDWQVGVSVQQQLLPRVSVEIGYLKRWLQNFTSTDNLAVQSSDFTPFSITAPVDSRLPDGGGYSVGTLYNVVASGFGVTRNNITRSNNFGTQYQSFNGMLISYSARIRNGLTLQGGVNSGVTVTDSCEIRQALPETNPTNPYCHNAPGWVTGMRTVGAYTVPKIDVLLAGTFRSDQGAPLQANYNVPVALISAALGRPANIAGTTQSVNLISPGQVWGDRINEIDLRVAKVLRFGRMRYNVGVDVFNLINSNKTLTYNQTYSPTGTWLTPQSVLSPRFVKLSAQIDF